MKNFILLALLTLFSISASAQFLPNNPVTLTPVSTAGVAKATLTNTDTVIAATPVVKPYYESFVITISVTKSTGTLAGTAQLQATLDGIKWFTTSTTALVDGANDILFKIGDGTASNAYRIRVVTSGTSTSAVANAKYLYKRRQ